MKIGIADFEMGGLYADSSILLCCSIETYVTPDERRKNRGTKDIVTLRADSYKSWKTNRTNESEFISDVAKKLDEYDILVFHNGERFDKKYFNAKCLQYNIKPIMRYKKLIDPCQIAWRHIRVARKSLASLISFFKIPVKKTPIDFHEWMDAYINGSKKAMDTICEHCEYDILTLREVYDCVRILIDKVDSKGSAF
jgi:uncharacterized protein YprB with RNaseH-like and TPR domain